MRLTKLLLCLVTFFGMGPLQSAFASPFLVLHAFKGGRDGGAPLAALTPADDRLFGTTVGTTGGIPGKLCSKGCGTAYSLHQGKGPGGTISAFSPDEFPSQLLAVSGGFYATTEFGGSSGSGTVIALTPRLNKFKKTTLYTFCTQSNCPDGSNPTSGVIAGKSGTVYGTAISGGANNFGVVFELSSSGTETVLHSFCSQANCADGEQPYGGLFFSKNGDLYGTTVLGGEHNGGIVYRLTLSRKFKVLYSFNGNGKDGTNPYDALIADAAGDFFGTTKNGGTKNEGTVFRVSPNGKEAVLYSFQGGADGAFPLSGVIVDTHGTIYGTTEFGGNSNCSAGCGVIFKLAADGTETLLHTFSGGKDGNYPVAGLTYVRPFFYGTAIEGGRSSCSPPYGCGTAFQIPAK